MTDVLTISHCRHILAISPHPGHPLRLDPVARHVLNHADLVQGAVVFPQCSTPFRLFCQGYEHRPGMVEPIGKRQNVAESELFLPFRLLVWSVRKHALEPGLLS